MPGPSRASEPLSFFSRLFRRSEPPVEVSLEVEPPEVTALEVIADELQRLRQYAESNAQVQNGSLNGALTIAARMLEVAEARAAEADAARAALHLLAVESSRTWKDSTRERVARRIMHTDHPQRYVAAAALVGTAVGSDQ